MNPEFNIKMYQILSQWNPMQLDDSTEGDMEYYEIMDIIHQKLSHETTIEKIQAVYLFSFNETPEKTDIERILNKIYQLNASCEV
ncbi:YugE family protein [Macrococcus armenti]|uniref:DUF1871 family protein n=1 Tax=Macrococcus armenti TaxID=2875764 RepID=UPI001CC900A7|nr:DUF1871 family protein [Macrococcus armenti]UBH09258.1 YugE family protein [Macrococcus armenti]UBH11554.1 YugE family protein [Macrococcus armenti]UBH16020.1 YugE family protein [Macrococcus armenti]UBH18381.1 YugE family protein [Macrococcus armenti]UBH20647.1 YugE family protein [Macrococcus armenti]